MNRPLIIRLIESLRHLDSTLSLLDDYYSPGFNMGTLNSRDFPDWRGVYHNATGDWTLFMFRLVNEYYARDYLVHNAVSMVATILDIPLEDADELVFPPNDDHFTYSPGQVADVFQHYLDTEVVDWNHNVS